MSDNSRLTNLFNENLHTATYLFPHVDHTQKEGIVKKINSNTINKLTDVSEFQKFFDCVLSDRSEENCDNRIHLLDKLSTSRNTLFGEEFLSSAIDLAFLEENSDGDFDRCSLEIFLLDVLSRNKFSDTDRVMQWLGNLENSEPKDYDKTLSPHRGAVIGGSLTDPKAISTWVSDTIRDPKSAPETFGGAMALANAAVAVGILTDKNQITSWANDVLDNTDNLSDVNHDYTYLATTNMICDAIGKGLLDDRDTIKRWIDLDSEHADDINETKMELAQAAVEAGIFEGLQEIFEPSVLKQISSELYQKASERIESLNEDFRCISE